MAAAAVRDHGGSGAGALVGIEFRPITISIASDSERQRPKSSLRSAKAAGAIAHRSSPSATVGARCDGLRAPGSTPAIAADGKTGR
eukprot:656303-Prymnesium_polylepis.1